MPLKPEEVELGKSYQLLNGTVRKVFEIVPEIPTKDEISERDIIRYEVEKWSYDQSRYNGKTRTKQKVREKMKRADFAKEANKRLN